MGRRRTRSSGCNTRFPYDFASPGTAFFARFGGLYAASIRGGAYLAAGRDREQWRNFKKSSIIATSSSLILSAPSRTLQLGRAYVVSGNMTKAESAYLGFLTLWKNADPDLPVLKQASRVRKATISFS
jgi:hypothetical protein